MFEGCTALTASPGISAAACPKDAMKQMFNGCSSLKQITTNLTAWNTNGTTNWVNGVGATGDFYCPERLPETYGNNYIPTGWTVKKRLTTLKFTAASGGASIGISAYEDGETAPSISMLSSTDGRIWGDYSVGNAIALQGGESV